MQSAKSQVIATMLVSIGTMLGVVLHFTHRSLLVTLCQEDGFVESLTAIFYFVAFGLFLSASRLYRYRNLWLAAFGMLFFLIGMEEISWGQRAFGMETPASLARINVQEETTLHNIEGIHGSVRALALMFVTVVCFAIPTLHLFSVPVKALLEKLHVPVFPLWATGIVVISIVLMALPRFAFNAVIFEIDELGEFALAAAFVFFAWSVYVKAESEQPASTNVGAGEMVAAS
jgi:hypothetical protein